MKVTLRAEARGPDVCGDLGRRGGRDTHEDTQLQGRSPAFRFSATEGSSGTETLTPASLMIRLSS